jgi:hypothetical protein
MPAHQTGGEADDARGMADMFEAPQDVLPLDAQCLGREYFVGFCFGFFAKIIHEVRQIGVARVAFVAGRQMRRGGRFDGLTASFCDVALEQPLFVEMANPADHD